MELLPCSPNENRARPPLLTRGALKVTLPDFGSLLIARRCMRWEATAWSMPADLPRQGRGGRGVGGPRIHGRIHKYVLQLSWLQNKKPGAREKVGCYFLLLFVFFLFLLFPLLLWYKIDQVGPKGMEVTYGFRARSSADVNQCSSVDFGGTTLIYTRWGSSPQGLILQGAESPQLPLNSLCGIGPLNSIILFRMCPRCPAPW